MAENSNFFINVLRSYCLEEEKKVSDRVELVLEKSLPDLSKDELKTYDRFILPAQQAIKRALIEQLGRGEPTRPEWEANLLPDSHVIIDEIAREALAETSTPSINESICSESTNHTLDEQIEAVCGKSKQNWGKRILKSLEWTATTFLVIVIILTAFMMLSPKFGLQTHTVESGSMEPTLKVGGMIICKSTPVSNIEVGDIIGFNAQDNEKVTHRVIEISDKSGKLWFQTKGDANEDPDPDLISPTRDTVDRVIFHIPYLGFISSFMKTKLAFLLFICIPALILFVLFGKDIWTALAEMRGKHKGESATIKKSNLENK